MKLKDFVKNRLAIETFAGNSIVDRVARAGFIELETMADEALTIYFAPY